MNLIHAQTSRKSELNFKKYSLYYSKIQNRDRCIAILCQKLDDTFTFLSVLLRDFSWAQAWAQEIVACGA